MSTFMHYQLAQTETRVARSEFKYAAVQLSMAHIIERHAELVSQATKFVGRGFLETRFGELSERERAIALAAARYVVYSRTDSVEE